MGVRYKFFLFISVGLISIIVCSMIGSYLNKTWVSFAGFLPALIFFIATLFLRCPHCRHPIWLTRASSDRIESEACD